MLTDPRKICFQNVSNHVQHVWFEIDQLIVLFLSKPNTRFRASFKDWMRSVQSDYGYVHFKRIGTPQTIDDYVAITSAHERGEQLPDNFVPYTTFWLVENDEILGEVRIRHYLNERYGKIGGHIGYYIKPEARGKGLGKTILKLALEEAKKLELNRVLLTCNETNIPSIKIIESNGGTFERKVHIDDTMPDKLHYWIEL